MQLYVYWYSLDVVAMSYELYSLFGMQSLAGRGRRNKRDRGSSRFFEGRGIFSVDTSFALLLFLFSTFYFFSFLSRPTGKATINESTKALSPYYSLCAFHSLIFSKVDKKRKERQIVRKNHLVVRGCAGRRVRRVALKGWTLEVAFLQRK